MPKLATCKHCGVGGLSWYSDGTRWVLSDSASGALHRCEGLEPKKVTCKYCKVDDLYWSREKMEDGSDRPVLLESYGLPHGCDAQKEYFEAEKKRLRDEYDKEKTRINSIVDGSNCGICTNGTVPGVYWGNSCGPVRCNACDGHGKITKAVKARMLHSARRSIRSSSFWSGPGVGTPRR